MIWLELLEEDQVYRLDFTSYRNAAKYLKLTVQPKDSLKGLERMLRMSARTGESLLKNWYAFEQL